jgi:hypothetical protein
MSKSTESSSNAASRVDLSALKPVSGFIRTGRRWDVTHKEIVGEVIVLLTAKEITTRYGPAMLCDIEHQGETKTALLGGQVLRDQVTDLMLSLPVIAVIRKPARSYGLFDPSPEQLAEYAAKYR